MEVARPDGAHMFNSKAQGIANGIALGECHLWFAMISSFLLNKGKIGSVEQCHYYMCGDRICL